MWIVGNKIFISMRTKFFAVMCCTAMLLAACEKEEKEPVAITLDWGNNEKFTEEDVTISGSITGHNYVDLGLSVKWATCNIGANAPKDYGNYYAWAETTTKNTYHWSTYKYCLETGAYTFDYTKYYTDRGIGSIVDNKTTLEAVDDAATQNWGGSWRTPTNIEIRELQSNCASEWVSLNGIEGLKVISHKNGNVLFLPAAGYRENNGLYCAGSKGYYWSSSLYFTGPGCAYCMDFQFFATDAKTRYWGLPIRPVCK